ncbi:methylmalonyl Co-A mutase-associated GTPase MeaB [Streptomyces armeniacus]|uniref:Methylmalonyl Co-A mutase-associated GTPase MeaB n=1 Tax=Streptomyces armeniacus TaxID=83291 RepID=A0A345XLF0_9ACTN|nr:methylmalonyl Co-A mutase-associated GTPase MeaB [Streptomyces armeniacus]AXK32466.1 methylmalonyl Co-A mutase-associated GTPase MeaB [Streptomyces armeniacus]
MKAVTDPSAEAAAEVAAGSVRHVGRLITGIENGRAEARTTLRHLVPHCGNAQLIGVTGPPGAGKSTLVAALIRELRNQRRTVGVIAVDPSSPFSGGALLGDRDRMLEAAGGDPEVFIRSLASRGASGGLAAAVNDAVDVLDAMGKDVVIVETVGVGQGEFDIARIAHTVVLVLVPGYGDALQAMKAGITEIADVLAVNKGDTPGAEQTHKDLAAQGFERRSPAGGEPWPVPVRKVSALRHEGVAEVVAAVDGHHAFTGATRWRAEAERARRHAQFAAFVGDRLRTELLADAGAVFGAERLTDPYGTAERYVQELLHVHGRLVDRPRPEAKPETEKP